MGGVNPISMEENKPLPNKIAYFIGANFMIIIGLIFLFISYLINKSINKKQRIKLVKELLND